MAGNKFATMLHRNTHKITLILVYTVLEWILIYLLLLNSLFSYLIMKYANYFGLKPPCLLCSRIDHLLDSKKSKNSYSDLCEHHASEISKLGYCSNHQKLAESHHMCEDCSYSRPDSNEKLNDFGGRIAFFSWVKKMGLIGKDSEKKIENGETILKCSCCDMSLNSDLYSSPYLVLKPSWGVLDYTQKGNLITDDDHDEGESSDPCKSDTQTDRCDDEFDIREEKSKFEEKNQVLSNLDENTDKIKEFMSSDQTTTTIRTEEDAIEERETNLLEEEEGTNDLLKFSPKLLPIQIEDESIEMIPIRLDNYFDFDDNRFIPVECIDSTTLKDQDLLRFRVIEEVKERNLERVLSNESIIEKEDEDSHMGIIMDDKTELILAEEIESIDMGKDKISSSSHVENHEEDGRLVEEFDLSSPNNDGDDNEEVLVTTENDSNEQSGYNESGLKMSIDEIEVPESSKEREISNQSEDQVSLFPCSNTFERDYIDSETLVDENEQAYEPSVDKEDKFEMSIDETEPANLIEKEMLDEGNDHSQAQNQISSLTLLPNGVESEPLIDLNDIGSDQVDEVDVIDERTVPVERIEEERIDRLSINLEFNEVEEENKFPETPTSMEGFQHLQKKLQLLEKRESVSEESLDGSVISETENGDGNLTIEKLKSALKAEHKALSVLYAELEEERSASAIAANQTMAMITRLQEEKAAMQMEALQYQRMMDEQSEYDQEALQLMNELMTKREKEKQELEKELEIYRKKVLQYEAKEKRMAMKRKSSIGRSGTSSTSSSNATDTDELSIDISHENADEYSFYGNQESSNHNTPADGVLNFDDLGVESSKQLGTLDESLADFEEERQSILEQLKALEEKLFTIDDDEEEHFNDIIPIEHLPEDKGKDCNESNDEIIDGYSNDLEEKHDRDRISLGGAKAKKLLPLFDATEMENEYELTNEEHEGSNAVLSQNSSSSKFTSNEKKAALVEEVDHVYERLHALEADREFLKHCISSLKKGDQGIDLLREILQHLRDLRNVELRAKNLNDAML